MRRYQIQPRENWQKTVESQGFFYHSTEEAPYWDESVYYLFTADEIDVIEKATYALDKMCLDAAQHVIDKNLFERFQIPPAFVDWVKNSWDRDELTVYGRFDLAYDGKSPPKLLEYNADTPTALLEASVIQWYWMKDVFVQCDQFNSIHERLVEAWKTAARDARSGNRMYFSCISGNVEDYMTTQYLRDTAMQSKLDTTYIEIERIGYNAPRQLFVDEDEKHIGACFKLYPWEWMIREAFGQQLLRDNTWWLESPWKMLLSNKAILPVLYELFPDSPYILPASFEPPTGAGNSASFVRKPMLSREGANVTVFVDGKPTIETEGDYEGPFVYQQYNELPNFDGNYPVIGSWMVNGYACGMGIREDRTPVTQNMSRFVPHIFTQRIA